MEAVAPLPEKWGELEDDIKPSMEKELPKDNSPVVYSPPLHKKVSELHSDVNLIKNDVNNLNERISTIETPPVNTTELLSTPAEYIDTTTDEKTMTIHEFM